MPNLSLHGREWALRPHHPQADAVAQRLDLPPIVAHCLLHRCGDIEPEAWLRPSLDHLHDPAELHHIGRAVDRIRAAVSRGESVRIVTDYDVDGTTSSLILQSTLKILGASGRIDYHIPNRFGEGYGFSTIAAQKAVDDNVDLVLTADIGVRDHDAVAVATDGGTDVIICDHHLPPGADVPAQALAVLCPPKADCSYPNPALAACGVSLKLAQALLQSHPKRDPIIASMLKLAAIGTVADVVDLSTPENRAIVSLGLAQLKNGSHTAGLQALLNVSGIDLSHITASDLGYRVGPRINAAGRMAEASSIIELFAERDPGQAKARAEAIDQLNTDRRSVQDHLVQASLAQLSDPPPPFAVLWGSEEEGWHRGVVGIVAAKVRDTVHRPVAVVAVAGDHARGSIRSTTAVHAVQALDSVSHLLDTYGGHPVAAGFSTTADRLPELASGLAAFAEQAVANPKPPQLCIDAICPIEEVGAPLAHALLRLEPFGKGNAAPLFQVHLPKIDRVQPLGSRHLRIHSGSVEAIWWGGAEHAEVLKGPVTVAATLSFNHWRGRSTPRLTVEDLMLGPPPAL